MSAWQDRQGLAPNKRVDTMEKQDKGLTIKPCYASYRTIVNTFARWKESTVPSRVDSSVLSHMSGGRASAVKNSLEFLGLIEPDGSTTDRLYKLVKAYGTDAWQDLLGELIADQYLGLIGNLDLENGTAKQLEDHFATTGIQGSTRRKAIRFYLDAQRDAGASVSPHFKPPKAPASSPKKKAKAQDGKTGKADPPMPPKSEREGIVKPEGFEKVNIDIPGRVSGFTALFPKDLKKAELDFALGHLRDWFQLMNKPEEGVE